jgi:hypothetical protein
MTFKRLRDGGDGITNRKKIRANGILQKSPLERKNDPLEQQKKIVLVLSSDDRDGAQPDSKGDESSASDCSITLQQPLRSIYAFRATEFTFTNRFFSVQRDLNDVIKVIWSTALTLDDLEGHLGAVDSKDTKEILRRSELVQGIIRIPEGYYEFSSDPADHEFQNPLYTQTHDSKIPNLNQLNFYITDVVVPPSVFLTTPLDLFEYYPIDIRSALMEAARPMIASITTDRRTDRLTINWGVAYDSRVAPGNPPLSVVVTPYTAQIVNVDSTATAVIGVSRNSSGQQWVGIAPPNIDGPTNIALQSSILNNNDMLDPKGENESFMVIPVAVEEGQKQTYFPYNPPLVQLNGATGINRIPIRIVEPQTGKVIKSNNIEWNLQVECFTLEDSPF